MNIGRSYTNIHCFGIKTTIFQSTFCKFLNKFFIPIWFPISADHILSSFIAPHIIVMEIGYGVNYMAISGQGINNMAISILPFIIDSIFWLITLTISFSIESFLKLGILEIINYIIVLLFRDYIKCNFIFIFFVF